MFIILFLVFLSPQNWTNFFGLDLAFCKSYKLRGCCLPSRCRQEIPNGFGEGGGSWKVFWFCNVRIIRIIRVIRIYKACNLKMCFLFAVFILLLMWYLYQSSVDNWRKQLFTRNDPVVVNIFFAPSVNVSLFPLMCCLLARLESLNRKLVGKAKQSWRKKYQQKYILQFGQIHLGQIYLEIGTNTFRDWDKYMLSE